MIDEERLLPELELYLVPRAFLTMLNESKHE
jgi:hypothetical protein